MNENKRYVCILDHSEKEVRIFDEHNQKNIFNIFFEGIDSAICLKGALEDTVDLLNELNNENQQLKNDCGILVQSNQKYRRKNEELKQQIKDLRIDVLDSIHEADEIQCSCSPCVVEECVKKVIK